MIAAMDEKPKRKFPLKKAILTLIQVCVTLGILFWVFHDPKMRSDMWEALLKAKPLWLFAGFLCYGVVEILAAGRWYLLLRVQGVKLPVWRVGALLMLGIFFNQFLPGGTGGDLLKIFFLMKEIPQKQEKAKGLLAVLMDRLIGLMALVIVSTTIIAIQYHWLSTSAMARHLTWVLLLILLSSVVGIGFSFIITGFGLAQKLPKRFPMRDVVIDLSVAYNAYGRAWPASLVALISSFGVHFASFFLFCCAARALDMHSGGPGGPEISFGALLSVMPIIVTLCALPTSVGGTGVREVLFVVLLGPLCGVSKSDAVTLSLTGFMLTAAWGAIGGLIYLLYRPSQHAKFAEVEREVLKFEHEIAEGETDNGEGKPKDPENKASQGNEDEEEEDDDEKHP
jgi:uncharacterized membrane protein YbhN (UPF0104 family)